MAIAKYQCVKDARGRTMIEIDGTFLVLRFVRNKRTYHVALADYLNPRALLPVLMRQLPKAELEQITNEVMAERDSAENHRS